MLIQAYLPLLGGGVSDYDQLDNKPSIEGVTLTGDKKLIDFGFTAYDDDPLKEELRVLKETVTQLPTKDYVDSSISDAIETTNRFLTIINGR